MSTLARFFWCQWDVDIIACRWQPLKGLSQWLLYLKSIHSSCNRFGRNLPQGMWFPYGLAYWAALIWNQLALWCSILVESTTGTVMQCRANSLEITFLSFRAIPGVNVTSKFATFFNHVNYSQGSWTSDTSALCIFIIFLPYNLRVWYFSPT